MNENFRIALVNLLDNKMRSALTMLGMTIGVGAVILLLSLGQAFDSFIRGRFQSLGSNLIFVSGAENILGELEKLTADDVEALSDPQRVPAALAIMPASVRSGITVRYASQALEADLQAVTDAYERIYNRDLLAGRTFTERDLRTSARVAVIGQGVLNTLFPRMDPLEQRIWIDDMRFEVVGVLDRVSGGQYGGNNVVLIPLTTLQTRLSDPTDDEPFETIPEPPAPTDVDTITIKAANADAVPAAVSQIQAALRTSRGLEPDEADDFVVLSQQQLVNSFVSINQLLTVFLSAVASISLIVGGIGIMNIMLVTVRERTREIGLRKAVGAKQGDILLQFLIESVLLSVLGGFAGVGGAVTIAAVFTWFVPDLAIVVQMSSILLAETITTMVGVFFGTYPAQRAARMRPIDALRYE